MILHVLTSDRLFYIGTRHYYKYIGSLALHPPPFLYQISTSLLRSKNLTCLSKALLIKQKYLSKSLRDYLQINVFPYLVVVEQKK